MKPLQLVTFDLDDTLYPEREFVKSGFGAVAHYLDNLHIVEDEEFFPIVWKLFENGARGTIFNQALELLGIDFPPDLIPELVAVYRGHQPDIHPFVDVLEILENLKEWNIGLALISDGPLQAQQNKLTALGLENYFEHIIFTGAYGVDWAKPSCRSFQEVMNRRGVSSTACVYVADNPRKDFLGPNLLGWRTIRVRFRSGLYINENPIAGGEPQETVDNFKALKGLLLTQE